MNRYPMQRQAQQVQAQGRYGDSVLVHMNPAEVAGIAALTPGGLTRNPQTGQPEAFAFLIPMLASWGASSAAAAGALGALTPALAGGIASGLATTGIGLAQGKDLKDAALAGAVSGVTGAALGSATGAGSVSEGALAQDAARAAASTVNPSSAAGAGVNSFAANTVDATGKVVGAGPGVNVWPLNNGAAADAAKGFNAEMFPGVDAATKSMSQSLTNAAKPPGWTVAGGQGNINPPLQAGMSYTPPPPSGMPQTFGEAVKNQFTGEKTMLGSLMDPKRMIPFYMGAGQGASMEADWENQQWMAERAAKNKAKKDKSYSMLNRIYGGYSGGGVVRPMVEGGPTNYTPAELEDIRRRLYGTYGTPAGYYGTPPDPRAINDPIALQRRQHWYDPAQQDSPYTVVRPPQDYMPGFSPEFPYFQQRGVTAANQTIPSYEAGPWTGTVDYYHPYYTPINRFLDPSTGHSPTWWPHGANQQPYFNSVVPQGKGGKGGQQPQAQSYVSALMQGKGGGQQAQQAPAQQAPVRQTSTAMAAGGPAPAMPPPMPPEGIMEAAPAPAAPPQGGIAALGGQPPVPPAPAALQGQQGAPSPQELEMVAMAIAGMAGEQGQKIIDMFVKKYGPDVFRQVREAVLQMIQPNAQTEGMVKGQGGGMDDQVGGMIGAQQPVAVSPGEYIVPADVVSGIGDGSSDAGAQELDKMAQNIRMARGGSAMQPPALDAGRYLPG